MNTETSTHPFKDEAHDRHLLLLSKDAAGAEEKQKLQAVYTACSHLPLLAAPPLPASLPFKFVLKSLFPKTGLIRFSGLRFNSLPSIYFLHGRKSPSIKGDKDISTSPHPQTHPPRGPDVAARAPPETGNIRFLSWWGTVRGAGKGESPDIVWPGFPQKLHVA